MIYILTLQFRVVQNIFKYTDGKPDFKGRDPQRDCVLTEYEDRYKQISLYIHNFWKDLHVKNGCVCIDDRIAIPNSIKDAYVEAIHATHPGSWGMTDMGTHAWWPYMHRDIITKMSKCNPCVKIDMETVRWEDLISEENWDLEARCDKELEQNRDKLSKDAARRKNADPEKNLEYFLTLMLFLPCHGRRLPFQ